VSWCRLRKKKNKQKTKTTTWERLDPMWSFFDAVSILLKIYLCSMEYGRDFDCGHRVFIVAAIGAK